MRGRLQEPHPSPSRAQPAAVAARAAGQHHALAGAGQGRTRVRPQPDLADLKRRADFYVTGERPGPADVLLLVEVADGSLRFDRMVKLLLYARAGIAELWTVDLKRRAIDVHRDPSDGEYQITTTHHAGDSIALFGAPEITVRLDLVFG